MKKISLKKGLNLNLAGGVAVHGVTAVAVNTVAVTPDDFPGFTPKPDVQPGDTVAAGAPLAHDKNHPEMKLCSPVAGKVKEIVRGARRKIERIIVEADDTVIDDKVMFDSSMPLMELLLSSGLWLWMRQRPFDIVPVPDVTPRDIFVTAVYSAPLELDTARRIVAEDKALLELATGFLAEITTGSVYISHRASWTLGPVQGAKMVMVEGPHPAGNAGVQAANIAPVNKGETVWTLDIETLRRLGHLLRHGKIDNRATVSVCGPAVENRYIAKTIISAAMEALMAGVKAVGTKHHRIVSGNVLVGTVVAADGYLRYPYRMLTVLDEGDDVDEFMGWASMSPAKMSVSRTFPGHFLKRLFRPDARLLGGRRAMIMSGEYDAMMPMDVMPEYLLKAIIARDIENMERLGIYEVAPEDFALAEYADASKIPLQHIVREGLDYLRKELE